MPGELVSAEPAVCIVGSALPQPHLVHLHSVVHVQQVAVLHPEVLQILLRAVVKSQVAPRALHIGIIGAAQQQAGQAQAACHLFYCLHQGTPMPLASPCKRCMGL